MTERLKAFLRNVQPWQAIVAALMLLALVLIVIAVAAVGAWLNISSVDQELDQQEPPRVEVAPSPQNPPTLPAPESFEDLPPEQRPEVSDLAVMDVIGFLQYGPGGDAFVCSGPMSGRGDTTVWECRSAPEGGPPAYEVRVTGDGPLSIFSVEATVYDATQEEAAEFLGYVGSLSFEEPEPVNVRAWVEGNVPAGGQLIADDAELTLYGTNEVRTLIVAGVPQVAPGGAATVQFSEEFSLPSIPDDSEEDGGTN